MYAIYGNIYHQYTPFMLAYIPAPWILWVGKPWFYYICPFTFTWRAINPWTSLVHRLTFGPRCSSHDEEARGGPSSASAHVNWWKKMKKHVGKYRKMVISWRFLVEKL